MFVNKKLAIFIYGPVFVFSIGNVDLLEFCFVGFWCSKREVLWAVVEAKRLINYRDLYSSVLVMMIEVDVREMWVD